MAVAAPSSGATVGERSFAKTMIERSSPIPKRVLWLNTLLSQVDNHIPIQAELKKGRVIENHEIDLARG